MYGSRGRPSTQFLELIFPGTAETLWPWPLSPLTARCVSAWLLFAAVVAFVVARLRGRAGSEVALVVCTLLPLLQGIAMARFHEQVDWDAFAAVLVISLLTLTMLSGLLGFLLVRRSEAGAR